MVTVPVGEKEFEKKIKISMIIGYFKEIKLIGR